MIFRLVLNLEHGVGWTLESIRPDHEAAFCVGGLGGDPQAIPLAANRTFDQSADTERPADLQSGHSPPLERV